MLMILLIYILSLSILLIAIFLIMSKKSFWDLKGNSPFECGFTAYFGSRSPFSIQYFCIALTFLLMDLELCFLMPFFTGLRETMLSDFYFFLISLVLTLILLEEWLRGLLDWKI